jgi:hypothetical protein
MANIPVKKDDGVTTVYLKAAGAGSDGDPFVAEHSNANLDIALSALRDAIAGSGAGAKTLANIVTLLAGGLPAGLAAGGGMKVEGVAGGVAVPVSGTVTASGPLTDTELRAAPVPVRGEANSVQATLTVTNGAYTAQDVVGGLITFAGAVRANGGEAILNSLALAGMTSAIALELWLLNADLATPVADNGAFAIVAADQPKVLGGDRHSD